MKFYDCETAPNPRRVRIFMAEKGIEIETIQVDLRNGEQLGEDFKKINPDCVVPVLELDSGERLTEVLAICDYFEALHPEPALFGITPEERSRVLMWHVKAEQQGLACAADAFRNTAKGFKDRAVTGPVGYAQIPELAERGRQRLAQFYAKLDEHLANNKYVAGERYSIADITAMTSVDFGSWAKVALAEDAEHVRRWYDSVSSRPSAAA